MGCFKELSGSDLLSPAAVVVLPPRFCVFEGDAFVSRPGP